MFIGLDTPQVSPALRAEAATPQADGRADAAFGSDQLVSGGRQSRSYRRHDDACESALLEALIDGKLPGVYDGPGGAQFCGGQASFREAAFSGGEAGFNGGHVLGRRGRLQQCSHVVMLSELSLRGLPGQGSVFSPWVGADGGSGWWR